MSEKRYRVPEWRVTVLYGAWIVRFWFEADKTFGGVSLLGTAKAQAELALTRFPPPSARAYHSNEMFRLAGHLIDSIPALSSVEVCDAFGQGVALHKDWP